MYVYYMPRLVWLHIVGQVKRNVSRVFVNLDGRWRKGRVVTLVVIIIVAGLCLQRALGKRLRREEGRSDEESALWIVRTGQGEEEKKAR